MAVRDLIVELFISHRPSSMFLSGYTKYKMFIECFEFLQYDYDSSAAGKIECNLYMMTSSMCSLPAY
jgi:hypothetical protein